MSTPTRENTMTTESMHAAQMRNALAHRGLRPDYSVEALLAMEREAAMASVPRSDRRVWQAAAVVAAMAVLVLGLALVQANQTPTACADATTMASTLGSSIDRTDERALWLKATQALINAQAPFTQEAWDNGISDYTRAIVASEGKDATQTATVRDLKAAMARCAA